MLHTFWLTMHTPLLTIRNVGRVWKKPKKKGKRDEEYPRIRIWGFSFLVCCFTYVNLCISMFFVIHTYIDRHKYIYISVCVWWHTKLSFPYHCVEICINDDDFCVCFFLVLVIWVVFIAVAVVVHPTSYKCKIFCIHMGSTGIAGDESERSRCRLWSQSLWGPQLPKGELAPPQPVPLSAPASTTPLAFELKFGNLFFQFWLPCSKASALIGYM